MSRAQPAARPPAPPPGAAGALEWRWRGHARPADTGPADTVELRLVRGAVRAERTAGLTVEVDLLRRGLRSDPAAVAFAVDSAPRRVRIEDRYPGAYGGARGPGVFGGASAECRPPDGGRGDFWHSDVRVEAVVRVPRGVSLVVRLLDGDIDVRGFDGPRAVATNQGTVAGVARLP